jgi:hypothetical protein
VKTQGKIDEPLNSLDLRPRLLQLKHFRHQGNKTQTTFCKTCFHQEQDGSILIELNLMPFINIIVKCGFLVLLKLSASLSLSITTCMAIVQSTAHGPFQEAIRASCNPSPVRREKPSLVDLALPQASRLF